MMRLCEQCPSPVYCSLHDCEKNERRMKTVAEAGMEAKDTNPKDIASVTKVATSLVPDVAQIELAQALRDGAKKYGPYNWREAPVKATVYLNAIERHLMLYRAGQNYASDSKVKHLASIMSGCAILLDAALNGTLIDDRHKMEDPDALDRLLEQYRSANSND